MLVPALIPPASPWRWWRSQRRGGTSRAAAAPTKPSAYLRTKVEEMVALQPVMMFSKSWCPFCAKAKQALQENGIQVAVLELDTLGSETEAEIQDILADVAGAKTVPRVFIGGKCIGGGDDTVRLGESGELAELAKSAKEAHMLAVANQESFQLQKSDAEWQQSLDMQQFRILRGRGTEPPGSHPYDQFLPEVGHFSCGGCGLPLYSAESKFASRCGWPVFDKIYTSGDLGQHVKGRPDGSGSLEIVCSRCGSHLGHVFYDSVTEKNPNGERH